MTPTILFKGGKPIAAYGSPGGARIINTVLQITRNLIDHGMAIQEAIDAPRVSVTSAAGFLSREAGFSAAALQGLLADRSGGAAGEEGGRGPVFSAQ